jgi:hypothetical protein
VLFFEAKSAAKELWTKEVWIYDYRTNVHHTEEEPDEVFKSGRLY